MSEEEFEVFKNLEKKRKKIDIISNTFVIIVLIFLIILFIFESKIQNKVIKQDNCVSLNGNYYCKLKK